MASPSFSQLASLPNFSYVVPGKLAGSGQLSSLPFPYKLTHPHLLQDVRKAQLTALRDLMIGGIVSLSGNEFTPEMLQEYGIKQLDLPVRDGFTPSLSQVKQFEAFVDDVHGSSGKATVVHCLAGLGRTGTMLAAYCMLKDPSLSAGEAVQRVRALRPGSVETYRQVQFLRELQEHLNKPAAPQAHYVDE